jgi:hypothetical protein
LRWLYGSIPSTVSQQRPPRVAVPAAAQSLTLGNETIHP